MKPEDYQKVKKILQSAVELAPGERDVFLDEECRGDENLRREVEELLKAEDSRFMEELAVAQIAGAIVNEETKDKPDKEESETITTEILAGHLNYKQFGNYKVVSWIGKGGMGEVYLARDLRLDRRVAIKFLRQDFSQDSEKLNRFIQEAKAASSLNHPNILTIYEIGRTDDTHYIASEYVEGRTLREYFTGRPPVTDEIIDIAIQMAGALSEAHRAGIVHRDIKPENVMIRRDRLIKILDFGLAKLTQKQNSDEPDSESVKTNLVSTHPGLIMGTPQYMSPEQAKGIRVDERSDVWSLGVMLYEMVTGRLPFDGATPSDVIAAILRSEPPPIRNFTTDFPAGLQEVINRALSKDTGRRYLTSKAMLEDLRQLKRRVELGVDITLDSLEEERYSLAILPFRNLTNDEETGFYEFALADAIITEFARIRSVAVRPSSVVAKYMGQPKDPIEIGKELNVRSVLAANFFSAGETIRVTTQLIDVASEKILWGDRIDAEKSDIIRVQDTIVKRVIDGLRIELDSENEQIHVEKSSNADAYQEYLKGRDRMRRYIYQTVANEDIEAALDHFNNAVRLDPGFGLAFCGLGSAYIQRVFKGMGGAEDIERSESALIRGLELDPGNIEARSYQAYLQFAGGRPEEAIDQVAVLKKEAPLNPLVHFMNGLLFRCTGRYQKAFRSWQELLRFDPTAKVVIHYNRARVFVYQAQYENAFGELNQALEIEPYHPFVNYFHAVTLFHSGHPDQAAELLSRLILSEGRDVFRPYYAICLSALGEHKKAREQLIEPVFKLGEIDHDISYWIASAYVMGGQFEEGLEWLEKSIRMGHRNRPWFERNQIWNPLHEDERFKNLIDKIK